MNNASTESPEDIQQRDSCSRICERALLVGIKQDHETRDQARAHLDELVGLVDTLDIPVVHRVMVSLREINPKWYVGAGKVLELSQLVRDCRADLLVFDTDLGPVHQRNLEQHLGRAVIDRREVILDIFADHATTREAVLQVALARMQYSLPRLTRAWTHLSRQRGGARGTRGKGESQLESDRRVVISKIARFRKELDKVESQRETRRKRRSERPVPSISLVGYTNAGKSSLLNALCGSRVLAENRLFATLDTTTRKLVFPGGRHALVSDTVGFIRKLPHDLVNAFHSTLEEATRADVLVIVSDASSRECADHYRVTQQVLQELDTEDIPVIHVLNKTDALGPEERLVCLAEFPHALPVSALTGTGISELMNRLEGALDINRQFITLLLPPDRWDLHSRIHAESRVVREDYEDQGIRMTVLLNKKEEGRVAEFIVNSNGQQGQDRTLKRAAR